MFCYSPFLSPGLQGVRTTHIQEDSSALDVLLQDKGSQLLKSHLTERWDSSFTCKRKVDIRIDAPSLPKLPQKPVVVKGTRQALLSSKETEILRKGLPRSHTRSPYTPRSLTPKLPASVLSRKSPVPRFEAKGVLGVVGNSPFQPMSSQTNDQGELWLKEARNFTKVVERKTADVYEQLDCESKGYITKQDLLNHLQLQRCISPHFQYQRQGACFLDGSFQSLSPTAPPPGLTDRLKSDTEDLFHLLKVVSTFTISKPDIQCLVAVRCFNNPTKPPQ